MHNYKQLLAFIAVVDEGGFSQAAKKLFITQPAVSWQIKSIEKEIGVLLIERNEREIVLTEAGIIFYRNAKIIINQYKSLNDDLNQYKSSYLSTVRIAASTIPGEYILPERLYRFKISNSSMTSVMSISNSKEVVEKVLNGTVCFGVVGYNPEHPDIEATPFIKENLVLVCNSNYKNSLFKNLKDILNEPLIMRDEGSGTRKVTLSYLHEHGINLENHLNSMVFGSTQASLSAITAGLGIGWISEFAIKDALELNKLKYIDQKFNIQRQFYVITYKRRSLSPIASEFKHFLLNKEIS